MGGCDRNKKQTNAVVRGGGGGSPLSFEAQAGALAKWSVPPAGRRHGGGAHVSAPRPRGPIAPPPPPSATATPPRGGGTCHTSAAEHAGLGGVGHVSTAPNTRWMHCPGGGGYALFPPPLVTHWSGGGGGVGGLEGGGGSSFHFFCSNACLPPPPRGLGGQLNCDTPPRHVSHMSAHIPRGS